MAAVRTHRARRAARPHAATCTAAAVRHAALIPARTASCGQHQAAAAAARTHAAKHAPAPRPCHATPRRTPRGPLPAPPNTRHHSNAPRPMPHARPRAPCPLSDRHQDRGLCGHARLGRRREQDALQAPRLPVVRQQRAQQPPGARAQERARQRARVLHPPRGAALPRQQAQHLQPGKTCGLLQGCGEVDGIAANAVAA